MKTWTLLLLGLIVVSGAIWVSLSLLNQATRGDSQQNRIRKETSPNSQNMANDPEVVAQNLIVPWEIIFLPDNTILVTQRSGSIVRIEQGKQTTITVEEINAVGEGGLLGAAIHPDFTSNQWLYLYETFQANKGPVNRVVRYIFDPQANTLNRDKTIIGNIPGAFNHDGGRIAFGPDGLLYITTGDADMSATAQDIQSLAGKILRVDAEGGIPEDNPFGNAVYSYGHRNPQGITWDEEERLWATEHGPSGLNTGYDELNIIEKGNNYGWPLITGDETRDEMVSPVIQSGGEETWAPAAAVYYQNHILFTGLRGESLYSYDMGNQDLDRYLQGTYGRLRALRLGPDGQLYLTTSNQDGRGQSSSGDDLLIRLDPDQFIQ